jgi:hypothetical protein
MHKLKFISNLSLQSNLCLTYPVLLSTMKQTSDDLRFASDFAVELEPHVSSERMKGSSFRRIAGELGITEPALKKCLAGRTTPSLRTVVLAFEKYGVSVPYSGIAFTAQKQLNKRERQRKPRSSTQLLLPFEIETPGPSDRLSLKLLPVGVRRYQLQVTLRLAR